MGEKETIEAPTTGRVEREKRDSVEHRPAFGYTLVQGLEFPPVFSRIKLRKNNMSSAAIILHSEFAPKDDVKFSPVQKTAKGSKIVYVNGRHGGKVRLQTPVMSAPFGVSKFDDTSTGNSSYSLDLSFRDMDTEPKIKAFHDTCRQFDDHILDTAVANSKEWLGKEMSRDIVKEFYRSVVRDPSNDKYKPTIRLKISPYSEFYDENHNRVDHDYVTKGSMVRCIVEVSTWFVNKSFGVSLRILQGQVVSRPVGISGFAFADDGTEDESMNGADAFLD